MDVSGGTAGGKRKYRREGASGHVSTGRGLLLRAGELLSQGWSQGADARDAQGAPVDAWSSAAASWSLLGALVAVLEVEAATRGELPLDELAAALDALARLIEMDSLTSWNDAPGRRQAEVLSVVDAAAAAYVPPPATPGWPN